VPRRLEFCRKWTKIRGLSKSGVQVGYHPSGSGYALGSSIAGGLLAIIGAALLKVALELCMPSSNRIAVIDFYFFLISGLLIVVGAIYILQLSLYVANVY
jgi:hypothetical protein